MNIKEDIPQELSLELCYIIKINSSASSPTLNWELRSLTGA